MKLLDNYNVWVKRMLEADPSKILSPTEVGWWNEIPMEDKKEKLYRMFNYPVDDFSVVFWWYYRLKWELALKAVKAPIPLNLLEIGAGECDMIPQMLARRYSHLKTTYTTANMNKNLTANFKQNTKDLPIKIEVIEDNAQNIRKYYKSDRVDIVAYEHSVNDIIQAILAERDGIDTTNCNWWDVLPRMIDLIKAEYLNNTLEASVKEEILGLMQISLDILKPGGYIIINHTSYQYDLNLGQNPVLWENMIPIVRPWINTLADGEEVFFDGFDHQWWMFYRKN